MGVLGISTTAEVAAIMARLATLPEPVFEGVPQGYDIERDEWGENPGYRDVSFGSILPTSRTARTMGTAEGDQPHSWTFEVKHTAPSKSRVREMSQETDEALIGWAPTANSTDVKPFYYVQYDTRNQAGAIISYTAVRFYETTIGVLAP